MTGSPAGDPAEALGATAAAVDPTVAGTARYNPAAVVDPAPAGTARRDPAAAAMARAEFDELVSLIAHDASEPLRAIRGFATLLERRLDGRLEDEEREWFGYVLDGGARLQRRIDDLLAYSRAGNRELVPVVLRLDALVQQAAAGQAARLAALGGRLTLLAEAVDVTGDPARLLEAVQAVLDNAITHRIPDAAPLVTVTVRPEGRGAVLTVGDNGGGIPAEHRERVLRPFVRLRSSPEAGSGVGLSVAACVAQRHGGSLTLSGGPGTIATLTLPSAA